MPLEETLHRIEVKLERIEAEINKMRHQLLERSTTMDEKKLISLPDHLRKTAIGLVKVGQGTASDVCRHTSRARAVESSYLNQLEREGYVKSFRKGRQKVFHLDAHLKDELSAKQQNTK
ncbi:MAG: transcriptional regulator [Candidatus Bathyarchaeota archaeon]|nr:MAG: transcriptional regulator [Candidatus Bathyarchaeota archaeon]